jgi:hypothetical protein
MNRENVYRMRRRLPAAEVIEAAEYQVFAPVVAVRVPHSRSSFPQVDLFTNSSFASEVVNP